MVCWAREAPCGAGRSRAACPARTASSRSCKRRWARPARRAGSGYDAKRRRHLQRQGRVASGRCGRLAKSGRDIQTIRIDVAT
eukprot:scaffold212788_cov30-Tisochrysis_lutea.AAC.1